MQVLSSSHTHTPSFPIILLNKSDEKLYRDGLDILRGVGVGVLPFSTHPFHTHPRYNHISIEFFGFLYLRTRTTISRTIDIRNKT
jgi:hypothetical protein